MRLCVYEQKVCGLPRSRHLIHHCHWIRFARQRITALNGCFAWFWMQEREGEREDCLPTRLNLITLPCMCSTVYVSQLRGEGRGFFWNSCLNKLSATVTVTVTRAVTSWQYTRILMQHWHTVLLCNYIWHIFDQYVQKYPWPVYAYTDTCIFAHTHTHTHILHAHAHHQKPQNDSETKRNPSCPRIFTSEWLPSLSWNPIATASSFSACMLQKCKKISEFPVSFSKCSPSCLHAGWMSGHNSVKGTRLGVWRIVCMYIYMYMFVCVYVHAFAKSASLYVHAFATISQSCNARFVCAIPMLLTAWKINMKFKY